MINIQKINMNVIDKITFIWYFQNINVFELNWRFICLRKQIKSQFRKLTFGSRTAQFLSELWACRVELQNYKILKYPFFAKNIINMFAIFQDFPPWLSPCAVCHLFSAVLFSTPFRFVLLYYFKPHKELINLAAIQPKHTHTHKSFVNSMTCVCVCV